MSELYRMVENEIAQEDLAIYLNNLTHSERFNDLLSFPGKSQEQLFNLAKPNLKLADLIPENATPHQTVIFHGINNLPAFNRFQKRMCRSLDGQWIWGYNHQSAQWLTGPGYFVVGEETKRAGELEINYSKAPPEQVPGWPTVRSNQTGMGRLVYGGLMDYLRRVSNHVFIGEALKGKKRMGFFILCREN